MDGERENRYRQRKRYFRAEAVGIVSRERFRGTRDVDSCLRSSSACSKLNEETVSSY
jgi:hypothetical protein